MIKMIIKMLEEADGNTERIKIAQGKNKLPTTLKEGFKVIKREIKWQL